MRVIVNVFVIVFLSGCAQAYKYPRDISRKQNTEPALLSSHIVLSEGKTLYAVNTIDESDNPIIIGIHGLGGHAETFNNFIKYSKQNGISFLAFDLRGFGHWENNIGDIENLKIWLLDIKDVIVTIKKMYPHRKIILLGESLGASIVFWYCSEYKDIPTAIPDGIISLSIVTKPESQITFANIIDGTIGYLFYSKKKISLGSVTENTSDRRDTLKINKVSFRLLLQSKQIINQTPEYISQIHFPILALQGGQDDYSTPEDIEEIVSRMRYKKFIFMDECKHSLISGICKDDVFEAINNWTNEFKNTSEKSERPKLQPIREFD